MRIRPMFAWYDIWVGVFVDVKKRRAFVFPLPMPGLVVEWGAREQGPIANLIDEMGRRP